MQSHQSVLMGIGIENKHFFEKTDFFYNLNHRRDVNHHGGDFYYVTFDFVTAYL